MEAAFYAGAFVACLVAYTVSVASIGYLAGKRDEAKRFGDKIKELGDIVLYPRAGVDA